MDDNKQCDNRFCIQPAKHNGKPAYTPLFFSVTWPKLMSRPQQKINCPTPSPRNAMLRPHYRQSFETHFISKRGRSISVPNPRMLKPHELVNQAAFLNACSSFIELASSSMISCIGQASCSIPLLRGLTIFLSARVVTHVCRALVSGRSFSQEWHDLPQFY